MGQIRFPPFSPLVLHFMFCGLLVHSHSQKHSLWLWYHIIWYHVFHSLSWELLWAHSGPPVTFIFRPFSQSHLFLPTLGPQVHKFKIQDKDTYECHDSIYLHIQEYTCIYRHSTLDVLNRKHKVDLKANMWNVRPQCTELWVQLLIGSKFIKGDSERNSQNCERKASPNV